MEPVLEYVYVERRDRLTVAFRLVLAIPQLVATNVLGVAAAFVAFLGWWGALFTGRLPQWAAQYLRVFLRYWTRLEAYVLLLTDEYPPFTLDPPGYPFELDLEPDALNRLAVLFRVLLMIPAVVMSGVVFSGIEIAAFFVWVYVVITGRMPRTLFDALTAAFRFQARTNAYELMLTSTYPGALMGDVQDGAVAPATPADPSTETRDIVPSGPPYERTLVLSAGAKRLLALFIVLGIALGVVTGVANAFRASSKTTNVNEAAAKIASAHDKLLGQIRDFQAASRGCNTSTAPLQCAQSSERTLVGELEQFRVALVGIDFPTASRTQVGALDAATSAFEASFGRMLAARTIPEYTQALRAADVATRGQGFDSAYAALIARLQQLV